MGLADQPIKVEGLRELQAALKAVDGEAQRQLRVVLNDSADIVVQGARSLVPVRSGRARASIRAASGQREAKVKGYGKRVLYGGWLDFGGTLPRGQSRPFLKTGRYIFATYDRRRNWIFDRLAKGMADLIERTGLG